MVEVAFDEATTDRLRHDVTWREVGQRMLLGHERHTAFVAEDRTLAPQRLGEKRARHRRVVQCGGVELHELEVGDRGAGADGHGDAVTGGEGGIGGDGEALTGAARRDEHVASPHRRRTLGRDPVDPHDAAVLEQELGSQPAFADVGARTLHRGDQRPLDFGAGGVTPRVHDPGDGVPALARAAKSSRPAAWSKRAPRATSSRTRVGPSLASTLTASMSQRPAPATSVSDPCSSGESSSGSSAAATPPGV